MLLLESKYKKARECRISFMAVRPGGKAGFGDSNLQTKIFKRAMREYEDEDWSGRAFFHRNKYKA